MIKVWNAIRRPITLDDDLKQHLTAVRASLRGLGHHLSRLEARLGELESQDKLENFELQGLMSEYNEGKTLASTVEKQLDCLNSAILTKIG